MGQIDSFKRVLGLDTPTEENPYKSILESDGPEEAGNGRRFSLGIRHYLIRDNFARSRYATIPAQMRHFFSDSQG